jgi:hypothetical protein
VSPKPTATCGVRERLFSHYKTSLDDYYKTIVSMLDEVGIEEATYQPEGCMMRVWSLDFRFNNTSGNKAALFVETSAIPIQNSSALCLHDASFSVALHLGVLTVAVATKPNVQSVHRADQRLLYSQ